MSELNQRPTFLTVICILTFLGSGYGIINGVSSYINAEEAAGASELVEDAMEEAMEDVDDSQMSDSQMEFMEKMTSGIAESLTVDNIKKGSIVNVLSCLMTLAGAFFMWNLNRKGFYLYIVGILVMIAGSIVVYGGFMGAIYGGMMGFVGLVFIAMYGANLKYMN